MEIKGLEGNLYYIENKIVLKLKAVTKPLRSISLSVVNYANSKTVNLPLIYPGANQEIILDLSKIVKALFTLPQIGDDYTSATVQLNNQVNEITTTITALFEDGTNEIATFTRNYVRGGNFTHKTNQMAVAETILSPIYDLPYWNNYPFSFCKIVGGKMIKYNAISGLGAGSERAVLMPVKSCDGAYIRFLNSKGGTSYWLFDGYNDMIDVYHYGDVDNLQRRVDLGSRSSVTMQVSGKVSDEHYLLMRDLITSPYIHLWKNEEWVQIYSDGNNKWQDPSGKRAHKVSYRFNFFKQNNRSLLW